MKKLLIVALLYCITTNTFAATDSIIHLYLHNHSATKNVIITDEPNLLRCTISGNNKDILTPSGYFLRWGLHVKSPDDEWLYQANIYTTDAVGEDKTFACLLTINPNGLSSICVPGNRITVADDHHMYFETD